MDLGLKGHKALVTAASRGLGRACAERLVPEVCGVMPWWGIARHGWSRGAGWGNQTSPA